MHSPTTFRLRYIPSLARDALETTMTTPPHWSSNLTGTGTLLNPNKPTRHTKIQQTKYESHRDRGNTKHSWLKITSIHCVCQSCTILNHLHRKSWSPDYPNFVLYTPYHITGTTNTYYGNEVPRFTILLFDLYSINIDMHLRRPLFRY